MRESGNKQRLEALLIRPAEEETYVLILGEIRRNVNPQENKMGRRYTEQAREVMCC